ncbi:MAG: hypothetical protein AB8G23_05855 [Myxococcota bacterium]
MRVSLPSLIGLAILLFSGYPAGTAGAQVFVEYPGHQQTYGDHVISPSPWTGGPTSVTVSFAGDGTLHDDGIGASQRTARNTLNYASPYSAANPQNYDELITISLYGGRLPLLQSMAASGTSTLSYTFATPVNEELDLLVADLDQNDFVEIRAFTSNDIPIDMMTFTLVDETDLSTFKNTGTLFSSIVAPTPITLFSVGEITLSATDDTNYNRSLSVLRSPSGAALARIDVTFSGTRNSPDRASGNNASHVYVALATAAPEPGFATGLLCGIGLVAACRRGRGRGSSF